MTEAQIEIEFEHMLIDKAERDKAAGIKVYTDDDYEAEEAEEERIDSKLYIEEDEEDDFGEGNDEWQPSNIPLPKSEIDDDEDEWEDDEIGDF